MRLSAATRVAGVVGSPVRHSLSPVLHNAAFAALGLDWAYLAFEVAPGRAAEAVAAVRALGLEGLSVTMPHKTAAAAACDRLSPTARALGATNTLVRQGEEVVGESTDGAGLLAALDADFGFDPAGKRALVIGAGGAGRAVVLALAEAGAAEVVVANRTPARAHAAAALAGPRGRVGVPADAAEADLVVNATPQGMGQNGTMAVGASRLGPGQLVADLVYDPPVPPLVAAARARGAVAANGLGMLVHQAAIAFRLWTGEDPPVEAMSAAAVRELAVRAGGAPAARAR